MSTEPAKSDIRAWPGIVILALQWCVTFVPGILAPGTSWLGLGLMAGPPLGLLLLLLWWGFFSKAQRSEKLVGIAALIGGIVATFVLGHKSMIPMAVFVYGIPTLCTAFVIAALLTRNRPMPVRRLAIAALVLLTGAAWTMLRTPGVDGNMSADFEYRWAETAEERLLASQEPLLPVPPSSTPAPPPAESQQTAETVEQGEAVEQPASATDDEAPELDTEVGSQPAQASEPAQASADEEVTAAVADTPVVAPPWPGFRGPNRDGVIPDQRIATDWSVSPPAEIWRRAVGPGWGSFALGHDLLFTQEQRGDDEVVSAYRVDSGEPVWMHRDPARFWEALAGAGPRATPTLHDGRSYSLGATGLLNALDARTGSLIWQRNVADDTQAATPEWGFSSSPLMVDGQIVLHTGGPDGKGIVAYNRDGEPKWFADAGKLSYSSMHRTALAGVDQLLILTQRGVAGHDPTDGKLLWQHDWPMPQGARVVQPAFTDNGGVLIGTGFGLGLRRVDVSHDGQGWQVEERWTTNRLKPYYNDFVAHKGHAYGFDGRILAAVNLETGERVWKGGRYGSGQLVLLPEQDLLVVLSERGDIALVSAEPGGFNEVARQPAIQGKTWNHPVIVDRVLFVRNGEEMAAFRLAEQTLAQQVP